MKYIQAKEERCSDTLVARKEPENGAIADVNNLSLMVDLMKRVKQRSTLANLQIVIVSFSLSVNYMFQHMDAANFSTMAPYQQLVT